jgi:hypothetical protein
LFISSWSNNSIRKLTINLDFLPHDLFTTLFKISRSTTLDQAGTNLSFRLLYCFDLSLRTLADDLVGDFPLALAILD